jgi:hypothetical protein
MKKIYKSFNYIIYDDNGAVTVVSTRDSRYSVNSNGFYIYDTDAESRVAFHVPIADIGTFLTTESGSVYWTEITFTEFLNENTSNASTENALAALAEQPSSRTAFGELSIAEDTPFIQNTGVYGFIPNNFRTYSVGGTTGVIDRLFTCTSGTGLYNYGAIQSLRSLNYNAGQGGVAKFTGVFPTNIASSWSGIGLISLSDELSFGYNGTVFGVWHRYGGVAEVKTLNITAASSGSTNLTLTLNSVAYVIPLTSGTIAFNAYQIATWLNANQSIWIAEQVGNTVIIAAQSDGAKAGTYTYSHASSTATIAATMTGLTKTSVHTPQSSFSEDTVSWLNTSFGNVYKIDYQYLGFGNIRFFIENPDTGKFTLVHILKWANANTRTSLNNPSLRFGMYATSVGSTTDFTVQCASVSLAVQGKISKTRNPRAVKNTQVVSSTFTNILTLRNRRIYNGVYNAVEIEPLLLSLSSESTKNVEVELRTNAVFSGATNFQEAGTNLCGDVGISSNATSNGTLLAAFTLSGNGNISASLKELEIRIPPGISLTIAARVTGGPNANITAALTYYEDL